MAHNHSEEKDWNGTFFFIQGADTQLGLIDHWMKEENQGWEKEIHLFSLTIEKINLIRPKPAFFVICGDLINAYPGYSQRLSQEKDFKAILSELDSDIKPICVCGNHDIGDVPTPDTVVSYRQSFGEDYFTFWKGGCLFIVLNSQYYKDSSMVGFEAKSQEEWLDKLLESISLKEINPKHTIVFMHIPPFIKSYEESDQYFNLPNTTRKPLLEKLRKHGISKIFCGHCHHNGGGFAFSNELEVVITTAIGLQLDENMIGSYGTSKSGVRIVTIEESLINHQFYSIDWIPKNVEL